ncbi:PQQ-dependent sugar dehydrogenase [Nocardioides sp.]|uniref:PQQ-dependent sugar dehydrogenase n=1 Tax=Nocardioides sp. TaxID=35761 RepID=UPI001A196AB8|nr:PQQ-dependent sugar dehydrogenase [Nocardioides sp.]MBJ7359959.1 PQQ-dependent sugar dehydrogenase [Nocardioides sp.]
MRRTTTGLAALALTAALVGCGDGGDEVKVDVDPTGSGSPTTSSSPTETEGATGSTDPSAGSPSDDASSAPQVVETIATGLVAPWGLAFLPDGSAVVTERDTAKVLQIAPDKVVTEIGVIGDAAPQGEGGLLGVAVSPEFDQDRTLYFYVSSDNDNRIVTATLDKGGLSDTTPILTGIPLGSIHDGGRLEFGPDGFLYASTGETGNPQLAQDRSTLAGKILRLTPKGKPAPGNPFGDEIWSWGHRNVQGLAFTDDGRLWASEFGQNTFDELNRIDAGANYGWPEVEGEGGTDAGYVDPQAVWGTDVASPSGLAFTEGALYMAALRGNRLWKIPVDSDGDAGQPEAYFVGEYGRMRTVVVAPDGSLWLTTSNQDGRGSPAPEDDRILRVTP